MTNPRLKPTGITLDRQQHAFRITWADGHTSAFNLDALREACPCAACRGGHHNMDRQQDPDILELTPVQSYEVKDIQQVGKYAIQFFWSDGHNSGIYTWEYLRGLDPDDPAAAGEA